MIPSLINPASTRYINNRSGLNNSKLVSQEIATLLRDGFIIQCTEPPFKVNPLNVVKNSGEKLRLILNLSRLNLPHYLRRA